jgi:hypothetical protein
MGLRINDVSAPFINCQFGLARFVPASFAASFNAISNPLVMPAMFIPHVDVNTAFACVSDVTEARLPPEYDDIQ